MRAAFRRLYGQTAALRDEDTVASLLKNRLGLRSCPPRPVYPSGKVAKTAAPPFSLREILQLPVVIALKREAEPVFLANAALSGAAKSSNDTGGALNAPKGNESEASRPTGEASVRLGDFPRKYVDRVEVSPSVDSIERWLQVLLFKSRFDVPLIYEWLQRMGRYSPTLVAELALERIVADAESSTVALDRVFRLASLVQARRTMALAVDSMLSRGVEESNAVVTYHSLALAHQHGIKLLDTSILSSLSLFSSLGLSDVYLAVEKNFVDAAHQSESQRTAIALVGLRNALLDRRRSEFLRHFDALQECAKGSGQSELLERVWLSVFQAALMEENSRLAVEAAKNLQPRALAMPKVWSTFLRCGSMATLDAFKAIVVNDSGASSLSDKERELLQFCMQQAELPRFLKATLNLMLHGGCTALDSQIIDSLAFRMFYLAGDRSQSAWMDHSQLLELTDKIRDLGKFIKALIPS